MAAGSAAAAAAAAAGHHAPWVSGSAAARLAARDHGATTATATATATGATGAAAAAASATDTERACPPGHKVVREGHGAMLFGEANEVFYNRVQVRRS